MFLLDPDMSNFPLVTWHCPKFRYRYRVDMPSYNPKYKVDMSSYNPKYGVDMSSYNTKYRVDKCPASFITRITNHEQVGAALSSYSPLKVATSLQAWWVSFF